MARSIKSKRGMALRRIKRIRYAKKELIRLNNMLGLPNKEDQPEDVEMKTEENDPTSTNGLSKRDYRLLKRIVQESANEADDSDVDKEFDEVMVLTSSKFLRRKCNARELNENKKQLSKSKAKAEAKTEEPAGEAIEESTENAEDAATRKRNSKTLVDDFGSYPSWMNQKKIRALAKVTRVMNKKKKKQIGKFAGKKQKLNAKKGKKTHSDSDDDDDVNGGKKGDSDSDDVDEEDYASEVSSIEDNLKMETDEAPKTTTAKTATAEVTTPAKTATAKVSKAAGKVTSAAAKSTVIKTADKLQKTNTADAVTSANDDDTIETIELSD